MGCENTGKGTAVSIECSHCTNEIVGVGVILVDELAEEGANPEFISYQGVKPDGEHTHYYLLHPMCFSKLFDELVRQGAHAAMWIAIATTGDIRETLEIE